MARRFGLVMWWLGAILLAGFTVSGVGKMVVAVLRSNLGALWDGAAVLAAGAVFAAICWAAAFVLSGSFWRPAGR